MKIECISKQWKFQIDDQQWTVTYSLKSKYWHISTERTFQRQIKDEDSAVTANKNKAIYYLTKVYEEYKFLSVSSEPN